MALRYRRWGTGARGRIAGILVGGLLLGSPTASAQDKKSEPEWYDPLLLDVGAGIPIVSSGELQFSGDATVGYGLENFGFVGHGSMMTYSLDTDRAQSDVWQRDGSIEGWYSTGGSKDSLRLQVRAVGGGAYLESDFNPRPAAGVPMYFHSEDSWMGRGSVLAGAEFRSADALTGYVLAGGGFQYESYGYLNVDPKDPYALSDTTTTSGIFEGRMQVRWTFVPDTLSARLRGNGSYFTLTRRDWLATSSSVSATTSEVEMHQLELHGRLSFELDLLSFAGIVPFVSGGLDHVGVKADTGSTSYTAPAVGAGLFKPAWY